MIKHIYKDFLKNKEEYRKAELFWNNVILSILKETSIEATRRLNYTYSNGGEFLDGNPITDRYFKKLNKSIRIIQEEITQDSVKIDAWINNTEDEDGQVIIELVISLELSEESAKFVEKLIQEWIIKDLNKEQMERFIESELYQVVVK